MKASPSRLLQKLNKGIQCKVWYYSEGACSMVSTQMGFEVGLKLENKRRRRVFKLKQIE